MVAIIDRFKVASFFVIIACYALWSPRKAMQAAYTALARRA